MLKNDTPSDFELARQYLEEANVLLNQVDVNEALVLLKKAEAIPLSMQEVKSAQLKAEILYGMASCYGIGINWKNAWKCNQEALVIHVEVLKEKSKNFWLVNFQSIKLQVAAGQYGSKEALEQYLLFTDNLEGKYEMPSRFLADLHTQIATCYQTLGEFERAILYYQKVRQFLEMEKQPNALLICKVYSDLGGCYRSLYEMEEAEHYYLKGLKVLLESDLKNHSYETAIHCNIAIFYSGCGKERKALTYFERALEIANSDYDNQGYQILVVYLNMSVSYKKLEEYEAAHAYLNQALKLSLQIHGIKNYYTGLIYGNIGDLYFFQKKYLLALQNAHKGLLSQLEIFTDENIYALPPIGNIQEAYSLQYVHHKARIFRDYFLFEDHRLQNIEAAMEHATWAIEVMKQLRFNTNVDYAKLSRGKQFKMAYLIALEVGHTFYKKTKDFKVLENVFSFVEQAKSAQLLTAIKTQMTHLQSFISADMQKEERILKEKLIAMNKEIEQERALHKTTNSGEARIRDLQTKLLEIQKEYDNLMEELKNKHPEYYQFKYDTKTIIISAFQTLLEEKELLLEYSIYENKLFVFAISRDTVLFEEVELTSNINELVDAFQEAIVLGSLKQYVVAAQDLYAVLFQPIEGALEGKEKLLIVPDDALHRLSFDALLLPQPSDKGTHFAELPYLICQFEVQYHYSATLIGMAHRKKQAGFSKQMIDGFLGVAPVRFNKRMKTTHGYMLKSNKNGRNIVLKSGGSQQAALLDLEETEAEVKTVYEFFEEKGKEAVGLFYDMASKDNLLQYIADYKHILLSTHGFADTENSVLAGLNLYVDRDENRIIPEDSKLYISDVMNLQLKADLVVLSACESGIGKLHRGEGMMALHRAFLYAGASNIVYSLFNVPEDSTRQLVETLFRYILEGDNYGAALRKAKLDLINDGAMEPMDWAGFALVGR